MHKLNYAFIRNKLQGVLHLRSFHYCGSHYHYFWLKTIKWGIFVLVGDPLHCNQICLVTRIIWEKLNNNTNNRNEQFEAKLTQKKVFHMAAVIKFVFAELHVIANNLIKRALLLANIPANSWHDNKNPIWDLQGTLRNILVGKFLKIILPT